MSCLDDSTICLLQAGTLSPAAVMEAERHLASCSNCLGLLERSLGRRPPVITPALPPGTSVGRYIIINQVGRGGMGEVYAAYDPELDRKIAIKLLRMDRDPQASLGLPARLVREAQAIARLSHPSVVVVYDVGLRDEQVFIAMEFVKGQTAAEWVREAPRRWQEVLQVYIAAGRGLAAAHEAGLVHRDFKPQNVMVREDQAVRIMDFGLARWTSTDEPDQQTTEVPAILPGDGETNQHSESNLTRTGALIGTPAYMAPEQRARGVVDARSDQFSFCVSLYEALFGRRPAPPAAMDSKQSPALPALPEGSRLRPVPRWVRSALERGLSAAPQQRWSSMSDLLDRLEGTPVRRRRMLLAAVVSAGVVAAFGIGGSRFATTPRDRCAGAARRLDGVWELSASGPRRQAIRRAVLSRVADGQTTFARLERALDSYASAWVDQHTEACEATYVHNEQSNEALDLRMDCLGQRLGDMRALSDLLERGESSTLDHAVSAARHLPSLESCGDVTLLREIIRPSLDSKGRLAVERQRLGLAHARAMVETRRYAEAKDRLNALVREAQAQQNGALVAEALALRGNAMGKLYEYRDAAANYRQAFHEAMRVRHDEIAAEAAVQMVALGTEGETDSDTWSAIARDLLDRIGGHATLRAWLSANKGFVYNRRGDYAAAAAATEDAITRMRSAPVVDQQDLAVTLASLSGLLTELGRPEKAMRAADEAVRVADETISQDDPDRDTILSNRADALNNVGRFEEARAGFEQVMLRWTRPDAPDPLLPIYPLNGIARSFLGQGRPADALSPARRATKLCTQQGELDPPACANARFILAQAEWQAGSRPRAITLAVEAESILARNPLLAGRLQAVRKWRLSRQGLSPSTLSGTPEGGLREAKVREAKVSDLTPNASRSGPPRPVEPHDTKSIGDHHRGL